MTRPPKPDASSAEPTNVTISQADAAPIELAELAPVETVPTHPSAAVVETWFAKHFHNMGAALDVRMYALLHAAKEDLKATLAAQ